MNDKLGAKFNTITTRFSSRDSLGIESVAASISGELCPIVNTVTPRAFYWPFMCWIYYDFYKNSGFKEKDWKISVFDDGFLKRQDYYFVLANLLAKNPDQTNLVGKQKTAIDIENNPEGPFRFNPDYFVTRFGGMQYYNAGCLTMRFITDVDEEAGKTYLLPRLTQFGEKMALAFENVIRDTDYYKQYRLRNTLIPKRVLLEYANVISLDLAHFDDCKAILKHHLFERNKKLNLCAEYARQIYKVTHAYKLDTKTTRHILYDYYSLRGGGHEVSPELKDIVQGWEVVIGRQYFTAGIEMIWKYMLFSLTEPCSFEKWTEKVFQTADQGILDLPLADLLPKCNFTFEERETMVSAARSASMKPVSFTDGLKLSLSVYNRFKNREDMEDTAAFLDYGKGRVPGTGGISINEWIEAVDKYRQLTVREFLLYVMKECIVEQHKRTCFEKITRSSQSIDGFYFEYYDGIYAKNEHVFQVDFQGIRFIQLMQVMQDLDMFDEE